MKSNFVRFVLLFPLIIFAALLAGTTGELIAEASPLTYTEPYLLSLSPKTEMNVLWLTSERAREAFVEYGTTDVLGARVKAVQNEIKGLKTSATPEGYDPDPAKNPDLKVYQQIAALKNLKPDTTYYYRVSTKSENQSVNGSLYFFKTAPESGAPVDFALLSDLQLKKQIPSTVRMIGRSHIDFIVYNGDLQNTPWKAGEWFPVEGCYIHPDEAGKEWFTVMQQTGDGCRLLQYVPIFPSPGNHELTDQRALGDKTFAKDKSRWDLGIYMQLFRPLYPEQRYGANGTHWYSADWGDMHLVSLSVFRWHPWNGFEAPGWFLFDDLNQGSAQVKWLENDLKSKKVRYTWVTQHWHMLNRGDDGHVPFSNPVADPADASKVTYPEGDQCWSILRPLYEKYDVNGVSYGHSHVYERYEVNGVHYVEAASIGNNYRNKDDAYHPSGEMPVVEQNGFRSFMLLHYDLVSGLSARGIQASVEAGNDGYLGRVFDEFTVAK